MKIPYYIILKILSYVYFDLNFDKDYFFFVLSRFCSKNATSNFREYADGVLRKIDDGNSIKRYVADTITKMLNDYKNIEYHYKETEQRNIPLNFRKRVTHLTLSPPCAIYNNFHTPLKKLEIVTEGVGFEDYTPLRRLIENRKPEIISVDQIEILSHIGDCDCLEVKIMSISEVQRDDKIKCRKLRILMEKDYVNELRNVIRCVDLDSIKKIDFVSVIDFDDDISMNGDILENEGSDDDDGYSYILDYQKICGIDDAPTVEEDEEEEEEEGEDEEGIENDGGPDIPLPDREFNPNYGDEVIDEVMINDNDDDADVEMMDEEINFVEMVKRAKETLNYKLNKKTDVFKICEEETEDYCLFKVVDQEKDEEDDNDEIELEVEDDFFEKNETRSILLDDIDQRLLETINFLINKSSCVDVRILMHEIYFYKLFSKEQFDRVVVYRNIGFINGNVTSKIKNFHLVDFYQDSQSVSVINNLFYCGNEFKVLEISPKSKIENDLFQIFRENLIFLKAEKLIIQNVKDLYHLKYFLKCLIVNKDIKTMHITYFGDQVVYTRCCRNLIDFFKNKQKNALYLTFCN